MVELFIRNFYDFPFLYHLCNILGSVLALRVALELGLNLFTSFNFSYLQDVGQLYQRQHKLFSFFLYDS